MSQKYKVTVGITTFNRMNYIEKMISSLENSVDVNLINIRVYDDCSTEFDINDLKRVIPFASDIVVRQKNLKSDMNIRMMYEDFLNTDDDIFMNGDSDLIFRPGWLDITFKYLEKTDGVLSLYNSNKHNFIEPPNSGMACKYDLGSAGVVFKRKIIEKIITGIPRDKVKGFDWQWSNFLTRQGVKLYCLQDSYIQHIGVKGQNNNGWIHDFDYGLNFLPKSLTNEQIISEFIDEIMNESLLYASSLSEEQQEYVNYITNKHLLDYKVGKVVLRLPRAIKKLLINRGFIH